MTRAGIVIFLLAFTWLTACQKKDTSSLEDHVVNQQSSILSSKFSYSDSIFYYSATGPNKIIFPVGKPDQPGFFTASSTGLDLDSATGRINISRSETGLRYSLYYVSTDHVLLDSTEITLSGLDYKDSIYDLSSGVSGDQVALPIYNMIPDAAIPCSNNGNGGCKFDETDLNSDGIEDVPGANKNKLIVDKNTGAINLNASFLAGVFGTNPPDGKKKDVTMFYRLDDGSNRSLNKITLRLVYFRSAAYIPESMILEIDSRNERYTQLGPTPQETTELLYYSLTLYKPKRPPLIVIVSGR